MIDLRAASFRYEGADRPSVHAVELHVDAGECTVLCGPSGCGKTTLTRLVNGLAGDFYEGERTGEVLIDGRDTADLEPWETSALAGSVFQNPRTQFFNLDTTGEVAFGMENLGIPHTEMHARMAHISRELRIGHLMDRRIFALSGGQQQAIAFASVHAYEPASYVLDEPSSNLDPESMDDLARFIRHAKKRGAAVLIAEHRLAYLADVADRFVLMQEGRIRRSWSADEFATLDADERAAFGLRCPTPPTLDDLAVSLAMPCSPDPLCEARGLVAAYEREPPILDGCTIGFDGGCVTGIVGKNGTGKSTLLSCICGLHRERFGHVRFEGSIVMPRRRADRAFLVMQDPDYQLFRASVRAELMCAPRTTNAAEDARIDDLLDRFDLSECAKRHPASLSGGQKQRVVCAMAALSPARTLLFDEPTSGLDFTSMQRLVGIMRDLAADGKAIVVVSHDAEFLTAVCDRIVRLE